jgi:microcompartment protein CcmL/EutN
VNNSVIEIVATTSLIEVIEQGDLVVLDGNASVVEVISTGSVTINTTGGGGQVHTQAAAAATWIIAHSLGRLPSVTIYLNSGEEVDTDITATSTSVTVTFPAATPGFAILT